MNIAEEYFDAKTWQQALKLLWMRRLECLEDAAGDALKKLLTSLRTEATEVVLNSYLSILQDAVRGGPPTIHELLRHFMNAPKLDIAQIRQLGAVLDARSATRFYSEFPEVAHHLLVEQLVYGTTFWRLLFVSATAIKKTNCSRPIANMRTTIVIGDGSTQRRLFKVLPLADGGFAVTVPYHSARAGSLTKMPLGIAKTGTFSVPISEVVPFSASDRVKLSYHVDGFVQFSGENQGAIISGRDKESGEPRGLGLISHPLSNPIQTGPSVGCAIWGFTDFDTWLAKPKEAALIFCPHECYEEPTYTEEDDAAMPKPVLGYKTSIFVFPAALLQDVIGEIETGDVISLHLPMNIYLRDSLFTVKLIQVSRDTVLGVIVQKNCWFRFSQKSGFQLSGPGDGEHNMNAIYPALRVSKGQNLDYRAG